MLSTNQFRNGNHIDVDGTIFKIVEFQHVKPGKGGAFVRTKLRRASDGAVIDRTFRAGEKFRSVRTEVRRMQFLYRDGSDAHFMDTQSYEQLTIPEATLADALRFMKESEEVEVLYIDAEPSDVQLPSAIDLAVTETEPGLRGDTASGGRDQAGRARDGRQDRGAVVRQHRRSRAGRHQVRRVRLACLTRLDLAPDMRRTDQRRAAVWALYQSDLLGRDLDQTFTTDTRGFTRALAELVRNHRVELDELIQGHSSGWTLDRIAPLERSILRVGLAEMLHGDELPGDHAIPPEGAIDEAVETAKRFCGADAPGFVNGILGAVLRERISPT